MAKIQLGVMYGSRSCEHDVSVISAVQLMHSVNTEKYDVIPIYLAKDGLWYTGKALMDISIYASFDAVKKDIVPVRLDLVSGAKSLLTIQKGKGLFAKPQEVILYHLDCVIPVFHGLHGEDGTVQGLLELCNIPYTSCNVGASSIGMDKVLMKRFFRGCGFPVLPDTFLLRKEWEEDREACIERIEKELPYPVYCKPACLGSSIGVSRAENREELIDSLELAFDFDRKVLVEQGLTSMIELNCSVLGYNGKIKASEIEMPISCASKDLLDFETKYLNGSSSSKGMVSLGRILPAKIEPELKEKIQQMSKDIFYALDCKGVVRIDFMYDTASDQIYITEINTIPGSLSFYLWQATKLPYADLIDCMVDCAMQAQQDKDDNNYAFHSEILKNMKLSGGKGAKGAKVGIKNA